MTDFCQMFFSRSYANSHSFVTCPNKRFGMHVIELTFNHVMHDPEFSLMNIKVTIELSISRFLKGNQDFRETEVKVVLAQLGCIRLTLFRLFWIMNKTSKFSPDSQNNQIFS